MKIDQQALSDLAENAFTPVVIGQHGEAGGRALRAIMVLLRRMYKVYEPSLAKSRIVVYQSIVEDHLETHVNYTELFDINDIQSWVGHPITVELSYSGSVRVLEHDPDLDLEQLSFSAVVYSWEGETESFWAGGKKTEIPKLYGGSESLFSSPTFQNLMDALNHFRTTMVRVSQCEILKATWYDSNRLYLKAKPEAQMRRSLVQYLRAALRNDAEILPEQNVDESHPVDVKVSFHFSNGVSLIEIKWLGTSVNPDDGKISTSYSESRANSGAKQLAEYLDWFHQSAPQRTTRGVLVIFDARRRGLASWSKTISSQDGLYYAHREIDFTPDFNVIRSDFEKPIRMFAEPLCS